MRSIQELLQDEKKAWFYLKDQETALKFVEELNRVGARYLNGSPVTAENCRPFGSDGRTSDDYDLERVLLSKLSGVLFRRCKHDFEGRLCKIHRW